MRFAPTTRLACVVLATAPVWLLGAIPGVRGAPMVGGVVLFLILVAVLVDIGLTPGHDGLTVGREFPGTIGVGDIVAGAYVLASRWPAPIAVALYDGLPDGITREDPLPERFALAPRQTMVGATRLRGVTRGEWSLGPVVVRVSGRLGLVERTLRYALADRITVAPSLANLRRYRLLAVQRRLRDAGIRALRRRGEGTSFAGLREYASGDDPRSIDWKVTARRQKLITREFSVEQGQAVLVLVDAGRLMTQITDRYARFEYALSATLALADVAIGSGDHVGVLVFNDAVRAFVPPGHGRATLRAVREALLPVEATMVEPDYAAAFRTLDLRYRRRALVVLFTDVIDVRASQALIAHTVRSARRHLLLVVALRNEALVAAAAPAGVASSEGVYERAAAEELLSAREEALARMRQAGVSVIDVRPQALAPAVINRYLELKGRGAV